MKFLLVPFSLFLLASQAANAEFLCKSTVSYSWEKDKDPSKIAVFVDGIEATGIDEAAAKAALADRIEQTKAKASEQCIKDHQNQAGCVASKFASLSATLQALPFSSRKLVEESIASDCKAQQGRCLESISSDAHCVEKISAPEGAGAKEAAKETGKDAKKKK